MVFAFLTSKISIELENKADDFKPGDLIRGKVRLHTMREVDSRNLSISLHCIEWVNPKKGGGKDGEGKEILLWEKETRLGGERKYKAGEWDFEFSLPADALPTISPEPCNKYPTEGAGLKWCLHAKMDLPNSIDLNAYKQVFVY